MSKKKKYDELTEKEKAFVDIMSKGYTGEKGSHKGISTFEAYRQAGYSSSPNNAWALKQRLWHLIEKRRGHYVTSHQIAPLAAAVVQQLMEDETTPPAIRLKCAQDILHRTGFDKPKETITTHRVEEMSLEELDKEIEEMLETAPNVHRIK